MSDLQPIADRVEIEALRGEFTDATMDRDYDRWIPCERALWGTSAPSASGSSVREEMSSFW
jgi:hypothetical protein